MSPSERCRRAPPPPAGSSSPKTDGEHERAGERRYRVERAIGDSKSGDAKWSRIG